MVVEVDERIGGHGYPWDVRDQMSKDLLNIIDTHPQQGDWKKHMLGWGSMLNSVSHPQGKVALKLIVEDVTAAYGERVPPEVVHSFVEKAIEWRNILLQTQPRKEKVRGTIDMKKIRKQLEGKISDTFLNEVLGKK